jgi:hypothetical protein
MAKKKKSSTTKVGHQNYEANKKRKAERHAKYLHTAQNKKDNRLELLEKVQAKFTGKSHHWLRKKFGTLNIHRMKTILDDTWETSSWFLGRIALKVARMTAAREIREWRHHADKHKRKHNKFQKNFEKKSAK